MKKAIVFLSAVSVFALIAYACVAPSGVCSENGGSVSGTSATKLYYPCDISRATGATTMSSGFGGNLNAVQWLSNLLAEEGFVVLAFTPSNNMGPVSGWRDAHKNCIARLQALNSNHSKLAGKIDLSKLQTCGHSRGGGGALWAAADLRGTLKTTVGMAPWQTFTGNPLATVSAAALVQAGSSDSMAVSSMTQGAYNLLGNISKAYIVYNGLGHVAWSAASGNTASTLANGVIAWMRYYMDRDASYKDDIANPSGSSSHEWIDLSGGGGSTSSSSGSSSGSGSCN